MSLKTIFQVPDERIGPSVALTLLRVVTGAAFMIHGWGKIQNPFGWMGEDAFAPGIFQALAALSEFGGGAAWIVGALTPLASLGILCTMTVAFCMHTFMRGDPFVATGGGASSELAAVYFCVALVLILVGPGKFSVDRAVFGVRGESTDSGRQE